MGGTKDLDKEWLVGRGSGRGETPNSGGGVDGNGDEVGSYSPKDIFFQRVQSRRLSIRNGDGDDT